MKKHEIPKIDAHGLKRFGLLMGSIIALLFGLILPHLKGSEKPLWAWGLGAVFIVWAFVHPNSLRWIYNPWMRLGLIMQSIVNPIIMGIVFYGVIFPIGFFMRLSGKDPMARQWNNFAVTYRSPLQPTTTEKMRRPF